MKLLTRTLILLAIGPLSAPQSQAQTRRAPVIDMHLHSQTEIWADSRLCFPQPCERLSSKITDPEQLRPTALAEMKKYNVVLAVVSGERETVLQWTEGMQDRFITGIIISRPDEVAYSDLKDLLESGRVQVLGELTLQYEGIPIDDPSVEPMLALAHRLDLPVHVHVEGLGGSPDFPIDLGNPLRVARVLRKFPGLRIYLENAGWPFLEEVTSLMYQFPSVHADISTILHLTPRPVAYRYLEALIDNGLGKRLMYGSDQMIWPEVIGETIEAIEAADFLTEEQKRDILYNNAARFLRLSEEEIARHHGRRQD
jgi:predicted TIM-barrel fold metal-dependent hydrolase